MINITKCRNSELKYTRMRLAAELHPDQLGYRSPDYNQEGRREPLRSYENGGRDEGKGILEGRKGRRK